MSAVRSLRYSQVVVLQFAGGSDSRLARSPSTRTARKRRARVASRDATANTAAFKAVGLLNDEVGVYLLTPARRPSTADCAAGGDPRDDRSRGASFACPDNSDCTHRERQQNTGLTAAMRLRWATKSTSIQLNENLTDAVTKMQVGGHDQRGQPWSGRPFASIMLW